MPGHPEAYVVGEMANFEDQGRRLPSAAMSPGLVNYAAPSDPQSRGVRPTDFARAESMTSLGGSWPVYRA